MNVINTALLKLTGAIISPFAGLPAQVALVVLSLLAGIVAAIAFRYTSPQTRLKRVADQVRASLLAMRLFKEDLRSVFAAQGTLFKASGLRLIYSLPPLVVLIVPFVLMLAQLAMWYEFRPLTPGSQVLLEMQIKPADWQAYQSIRLASPPGLAAVGPVRDADNHTLVWRLATRDKPASIEHIDIAFMRGDKEVATKQLVISPDGATDRLVFVSPVRPGAGYGDSTHFWDHLLYPGEAAFDAASPIQRTAILYSPRTNTLFGYHVHWLVTFFIVSILGALAVKPIIKVQF